MHACGVSPARQSVIHTPVFVSFQKQSNKIEKVKYNEESLVQDVKTLLHVAAAGQTAAARAAGVLWRVATDCDKAKLEIVKAGAMAPAVASLRAACHSTTALPAATEVSHCFLVTAFSSGRQEQLASLHLATTGDLHRQQSVICQQLTMYMSSMCNHVLVHH